MGVILMIVGAINLLASLLFWSTFSPTGGVAPWWSASVR